MKNILVLTSLYPGNNIDKAFTPVVHYFTKEWVALGYNVKVVHLCNYFPFVFYHIPHWITDRIFKRKGHTVPQKAHSKKEIFTLDGVEVMRYPMFKLIPRGKFSIKTLDNAINGICKWIDDKGFKPDFIISHWYNPQLYISAKLKDIYNSKNSLVIHEGIHNLKLVPNYKNLLGHIDFWGYRSPKSIDEFAKATGITPKWFRCYSGVPTTFSKNIPSRSYSSCNKIAFVGALTLNKCPDKLLKACLEVFENDFQLSIIGEGELMPMLRNLISENNLTHNITLFGRIQRESIISILDNSDIFAMITHSEAFGLVYIEAMSRGCITIASRGNGMDGIIEHGLNGFLCEGGNQKELEEILNQIHNLSEEERQAISERGMATASKLTDSNVAKMYLSEIGAL